MSAPRTVLAVLVLALVATPALAHVPSFPTDNTSPDRAVSVPDAAKSWSFYNRVDAGEVAYYRFTLERGQTLRVSTFTPDGGPFTPSVVVASETFEGTDGVPPQVTVPEGMGAVVVPGERPARPGYEPFAPSATYQTASLDRPAEGGTYLVAVYERENRSGRVGVAVGYREAFSPTEYVTVPFDLVQVHLWAGQHPAVVVGPLVLSVLGGAVLLWSRDVGARSTARVRYALGVAALLVLASGVNTAVQTGIALSATGPTPGVLVTAIYVVVPILCGVWVVRVVRSEGIVFDTRTRAGLAVVGVLSLLTWAGFIVGPAVLLAMAVTPRRAFDG